MYEEFEGNAHDERRMHYRKLHEGKDLHLLVRTMKNVQQEKERIEDTLKHLNAEFDVLRFELVPERMENDGVERVSYEGIGRVSLTADVRVTMIAPAKAKFFDWLKKHKLSDLIQPGVNSSTLKAWVKDRIKQGKEVPGEYLNVTPITRASITKG